MGRHTAPDGDDMDPVVAAALARRAADNAGAHRDDDDWDRSATQRIGSDVGWPGEPPGPGGGVGWPGDLAHRGALETATRAEPSEADVVAEDREEPSLEPAVRRRGWRRLLGLAA